MAWHCQMSNGNGDIANGSHASTTGGTDGRVINSGTTPSQPSSRCATPGRPGATRYPKALEASPTAERLDEILRSATGLRPRLTAAVGQCRRMDPSRNTVDLPCRSLRNGPGAAPTYAQPGHHHRLDCTTEDLDSRTREDRQARVMWRGRWPGMTGQAERSRGHDRCLAGRYRRDALGGCAPADAEASAPAASSS